MGFLAERISMFLRSPFSSDHVENPGNTPLKD